MAGDLKKLISTEVSVERKLEQTLNKNELAKGKIVKLNDKENKTD